MEGAHASTTNTTLACKAAQDILGLDRVDIKPLNQSAIEGNWSQACWEEPACIIKAQTAQDVSKALQIVQDFQIPFTIRSGGHSPNPGWSSIMSPGILIDLSALDEIIVSEDRATVSVGSGKRWGTVYDVLDPHGVSVIGGRIPNVGVGGLLLGGGFFHFSQEYGLAADNVKQFEVCMTFNSKLKTEKLIDRKVVLADGTITTADTTHDADLFWALKGGGPNFGIVTRYELMTIPTNKIWYEFLVVSNSQAHAVIEVFEVWQKTSASTDAKGTVALIMGLDSITLGFIYSQPATARPAAFDAFSSITPFTTAVPPTNGTVSSLTAILGAGFSSTPARHDYRAASSKIDAQLYKDVYDFWLEKATAVKAATGANQTFTLQPVPRTLTEASEARGGNPMGIAKEDHQWWTTLVDWANESDDEMVRSVSVATTEKWRELGEDRKSYMDYLYHNDASRDQNPIATYGADNIARLKEIAANFDPNQVFQKLQKDGFLLSKV
ncbi:hypothetical protein N0V93_008223 [Gnomoniopsis smithogilvyi]|uniref:FAD-binding PCMH-type domain-containing protein n=1 Tax=Gnomoniopsis smithogilvyi TaxID=1191159 RepID=A0A9W8YMA4_9PEZI|nr:hypothetical protein N0V93_008223 [Gnomoniopsis smithogilvyi]